MGGTKLLNISKTFLASHKSFWDIQKFFTPPFLWLLWNPKNTISLFYRLNLNLPATETFEVRPSPISPRFWTETEKVIKLFSVVKTVDLFSHLKNDRFSLFENTAPLMHEPSFVEEVTGYDIL